MSSHLGLNDLLQLSLNQPFLNLKYNYKLSGYISPLIKDSTYIATATCIEII